MSLAKIRSRYQAVKAVTSKYNPYNFIKSNPEAKKQKIPIRQRLKDYVTMIANDYKAVALDTVESSKKYPLKATAYVLSGAIVYQMYRTNPNEFHYRNELVEATSHMVLCGESIRNKKSETYLDNVIKLANMDLIDYRYYILFSVIKRRDYPNECDLYNKQSKPLNNPSTWNIFNVHNIFLKYISSIVDIGVFDNWLFLNKQLKDYDINENEWSNK